MAKKRDMAEPFPTSIFVSLEDDGDGSTFLVASGDFDGLDHDVTVGIYQLVEVKTVSVKRELV